VVAGGDHVEAHVVEEVGDDLALVLREEQRTLEVVAGRQQHDVLAGVMRFLLLEVDLGLQPRHAAEAFSLLLALFVAVGIGAGDGFEAGMEIVDVQDSERELGLRRAAESGGECQRRSAQQKVFHVPVLCGIPWVRMLVALDCNAAVTAIDASAGCPPALQSGRELSKFGGDGKGWRPIVFIIAALSRSFRRHAKGLARLSDDYGAWD